jgi:hypothetical protein
MASTILGAFLRRDYVLNLVIQHATDLCLCDSYQEPQPVLPNRVDGLRVYLF